MQTKHKRLYLLLFVSVFATNDFVFAQKTQLKIDSTKVYKSIESFSLKNKFTRFAYTIFFNPVAENKTKKSIKKKVYKNLVQNSYKAFEGKIIRHVKIETLDPFGFSIADTIVRPPGFISTNGNKLHIKSQQITIRNLLLIRQNQVFDSLLVKESERLVRSRGFITDVSFFVALSAKNSDSVDVFIRELDNWSLIPSFAASTSSITFGLNDKNFLGLGHESQNEATWNYAENRFAYKVNYYIPNFRNTYINSVIHIGSEESGGYIRSFSVDRPFFSPFAKWAAGVNYIQQLRFANIQYADSGVVLQRFRINSQDYWAGMATQLFKGNTENDRVTNLILAIRYLHLDYLEKPGEKYDPQHYFDDENFYLASIGISTRKYIQDKYVFKFGITEDVPVGKVIALTGGYQAKNNTNRIYLGAKVSAGNYYPFGYLGFNLEFGAFNIASRTEQGAFVASANYFTGLLEVGKWKFRQFVKPQFIMGINRLAFDSLTLNDGYGISGFNSSSLSGSSRIMILLQTQSYSPWNFIGFRLGPYLTFSLGKLGNAETGFKNTRLYSQIGLGVLIKNDHLVINTFQVSIAFYPIIPGVGQNVFRLNSFRTVDFGIRDFGIGKPAIVAFE